MSLDNILLIPGLGGLNLQRVLFGAGEVGGIWDWSDRATMFQDVAGTQPITASGQTRALHLDKSKGLVLGANIVSGLPSIQSGLWVGNPDGSVTGTNIGGDRASWPIVTTSGRFYRIDFNVTGHSGNGLHTMRVQLSDSATVDSNIQSFTVNANGNYTCYLYAGAGTAFITHRSLNNWTGTVSRPVVRELPGNHRYQASAASRPQYIEDETGHYGLYDGVDDFDETNAIDFTGTDKMTVWWGGRKLSDLSFATLIELSANPPITSGTFGLSAASGGTGYIWRTRGSSDITATVSSGFSAPVSNVLTGIGDISGDIARLRVNGAQVAENLGDQGTGNYGNYKLYFGRRAGTSFPANIREYMTIIRGAQTTTSLIEQVERAVRGKIKGLTW